MFFIDVLFKIYGMVNLNSVYYVWITVLLL
jgi:hypothetical protein